MMIYWKYTRKLMKLKREVNKMDGYKLRVIIQTHISPDSGDIRYSRKSLESTNDGDIFIRHDH